jgi:hypothetical protein
MLMLYCQFFGNTSVNVRLGMPLAQRGISIAQSYVWSSEGIVYSSEGDIGISDAMFVLYRITSLARSVTSLVYVEHTPYKL